MRLLPPGASRDRRARRRGRRHPADRQGDADPRPGLGARGAGGDRHADRRGPRGVRRAARPADAARGPGRRRAPRRAARRARPRPGGDPRRHGRPRGRPAARRDPGARRARWRSPARRPSSSATGCCAATCRRRRCRRSSPRCAPPSSAGARIPPLQPPGGLPIQGHPARGTGGVRPPEQRTGHAMSKRPQEFGHRFHQGAGGAPARQRPQRDRGQPRLRRGRDADRARRPPAGRGRRGAGAAPRWRRLRRRRRRALRRAAGADPAEDPGVVPSPMVGTVYLQAEPETPAFVKVGDTVAEGQTILIIEAMKTMNQIPAPRRRQGQAHPGRGRPAGGVRRAADDPRMTRPERGASPCSRRC